MTFDDEENKYRLAFDPSTDDTSLAVIAAAAAALRTDPIDLNPLHSAIDPSALDELIESSDADSNCHLSFEFCGFRITITTTGVLELEPSTDTNG